MPLKNYLKKIFFRLVYEMGAMYHSFNEVRFMNLGIVTDDEFPLKKDDEKDRLQIQLYHYSTQKINLENKTILEIGCGRGGGSYFISEYKNPKKFIGIDISKGNIKLCNENLSNSKRSYLQADAENIPFTENSFDVVLNIESSHCYPNSERFLSEANRVLVNDGYFVFCDLGEPKRFKEIEILFFSLNFSIYYKEDITEKIVKSLDLDNERKMKYVSKYFGFIRTIAGDLSVVKNSKSYNKLKTGNTVYMLYLLKKNATDFTTQFPKTTSDLL